MRKFAVLLLLGLIIQIATPTHAAPTWQCVWDFSVSDGGWAVREEPNPENASEAGQYDAGGGYWESTTALDTYNSISISIATALTYAGDLDISVEYEYLVATPQNLAQWRDAPYDAPTTGGQADYGPISAGEGTWSVSFEEVEDVDFVRIFVGSNPGSGSENSRIHKATISGSGETAPFAEGTGIECHALYTYVKPITAAEVDAEWNTIETYAAGLTFLQQRTLLQYSAQPGAMVQAPTTGTVESIRPLTLDNCLSYLQSPIAVAIGVGCGISVHGYPYFLPGTFIHPAVDVVTITTDTDISFVYFVTRARDYVEENQAVTEGCWIGETFKLETISLSLGNSGLSGSASELGKGGTIFAVTENGAVVDNAEEFYVIESTGNAPCNQPEGYEECLGDAPLNVQNQWTVDKGIWNDPGVTLQPGGYISTTMNLLPIMEPMLKVRGQAIGGSSTLSLQLGQTLENEPITVISSELTIGADEHLPDFDDLYTVKIKNTGNFNVAINYICVQLTKDESGVDIDPPPSGPPNTPNGDGEDIPGGGGPYAEQCATVETPGTSDVGEWTSWLWLRFNNFHQCELMVLLNAIYKFMQDTWRTVAWSIRWNQAVSVDAIRFLFDLIYWLGGHLSNIALGQVTTIYSGQEQCGNIFCLLDTLASGFFDQISDFFDLLNSLIDNLLDPDSPFWDILRDIVSTLLNILQQIADLLINILYSVFNIIFTVLNIIVAIFLLFIGKIFELLNLALGLFQAIAAAWNSATPTPLPGIPDCVADPQTHFLCKGIWVVDNTVLSGTGFYAIIVVIGVGSIHVLLWVVSQYRKAVIELGEKI